MIKLISKIQENKISLALLCLGIFMAIIYAVNIVSNMLFSISQNEPLDFTSEHIGLNMIVLTQADSFIYEDQTLKLEIRSNFASINNLEKTSYMQDVSANVVSLKLLMQASKLFLDSTKNLIEVENMSNTLSEKFKALFADYASIDIDKRLLKVPGKFTLVGLSDDIFIRGKNLVYDEINQKFQFNGNYPTDLLIGR